VADRQFTRFLADVLAFGWVLPASIAAGAGLGWLADRLLGTFPVGTIVVGLLGFAGGVFEIYREMEVLSGRGRDGRGDPPPAGGTP
jgi:F0F1-type ATP synthase assembly protein I